MNGLVITVAARYTCQQHCWTKVMFPGNQEFLRGLKHHPQIDAEHADLCSAICENLRNLRMGV